MHGCPRPRRSEHPHGRQKRRRLKIAAIGPGGRPTAGRPRMRNRSHVGRSFRIESMATSRRRAAISRRDAEAGTLRIGRPVFLGRRMSPPGAGRAVGANSVLVVSARQVSLRSMSRGGKCSTRPARQVGRQARTPRRGAAQKMRKFPDLAATPRSPGSTTRHSRPVRS